MNVLYWLGRKNIDQSVADINQEKPEGEEINVTDLVLPWQFGE